MSLSDSSSSPLISIIVPIYGVEFYLVNCIESIIKQTYRHLEIILVNDGSPDNSPKICDHYALQDSRIKVIHKKNSGLVNARKAGLLAATGKFVAYVDGDDWVAEQMYEELVECALQFGADIIVAGHKEVLGGKVVEVLENKLACGLYIENKLIDELYSTMLYSGVFSQFGIFTYLWSKLFKKNILLESQLSVPDEIFMGEDAACLYPALLGSNSVYITNSSNYHYVQHPKSMVKLRELNNDELKRYNLLYNHLFESFSNSRYLESLNSQLEHFMLSLLTVRSGVDFHGDGEINELFAYGVIPSDSKLVVCGAGTFGQHLIRRVLKNKNLNLAGWIDELAHIFIRFNLDVGPLQSVKNLEFDYLLVAYVDEGNAQVTKKKLERLGVNSNKILTINHFSNYPIKDLLYKYGLELYS